MSEHGQRICRLAEEAARDEDPESALRTLTELREHVDAFVREHVQHGLAAGRSFGDVARALGISRQAAHRRFRELAPEPRGPRLVATADARRVVRLARAEALTAGTSPGSEHVLLGILHTDTPAARALQAEGVTLEAARRCRTRADGRTDGSGHEMRDLVKEAGRIALARGDDELDLDGLLLAALTDADGGAGRTLAALGVAPASIRQRLGCSGPRLG